MLQDAQLSNSAVNLPANTKRPRLITPISLAGFVLATGIVLALLYPQHRISEQIRANPKVDEVSLQYKRNLLNIEPGNNELRLALIQSYNAIGQYENALETLTPLYANTQPKWREAALLSKIEILSKLAFAPPPGSPDRKNKLTHLKQALLTSEPDIYSLNALRQFARTAESTGELQLAERVYDRLAGMSNNLTDLNDAARVSIANQHYLASAQFTWRARQATHDPEQKIQLLKLALATLQSGNLGKEGLEWVRQLPPKEWQRVDVLYTLTKLALASNDPDLASQFASQMVSLDDISATPAHFNSAHYDLAYTSFLGSHDFPHALSLAQNAVAQVPDNALWRERLAKVAEWSNKPQLAIEQWRWLAMHQGYESAWQSWMRLAGGLFDYSAQIMGLEHNLKQQGSDEKYAAKVVQLYEYLGKPEEALAWLDQNGNEARRPGLLLLSAELLTRMGRDEEALDRYRRYLKRNSASPEVAVTMARILQRFGLLQEAFEVLESSSPKAQAGNKLLWINLGELAWKLKHYKQAIIAYQILSDAPDVEPYHQERLFQSLKHTNPRLAAQTAETYWQKTGRIDLFLNTAGTYAELDDWQAVQRLYKITDAPDWREYDNNLRFIVLRAEMYKHLRDFTAAEHDYRFLLKRYPDNLVVKESFLWLLLDSRQFNQLDLFMHQWANLIPVASNLWDVFAAGHLALGRPNQALAFYNRMAKAGGKDEMWLLNYAVTLEAGGQPDLAWQIRKKIWQKRLNSQTRSNWLNTRSDAHDIEALRLLLLNDPVLGQGTLWKLLRDGSPALKQNSQFVELATVWLNDREQNEAMRSWLIQQYAHWLNTPLGVRISDALTRQDKESATEILNHDGILLHDKMNLSHLAGRKDDAADLAFIAMDRSRQDESLYAQAAPMLLANERTAGTKTTRRNLGSYSGTNTEIFTTGHQIGGLKLDLSLHQETRDRLDTKLLTRAPNEVGGEIVLHQAGNGYVNSFTIKYSQALNTQAGMSFNHQHQIGSRLKLDTHLSFNEPATENAALRLIGRRNQIALESVYDLDRWNQLTVRGEHNEFRSIDGQSLGNGNLITTTLTHELSGAHPALRARVTGSWSQFNAKNEVLTGKTASLIPSGQPNTAGYVMPQGSREIAVYASVGDQTDSKLPARNFEYMGELGVFYNTISGSGWRANAGVAGRIIGADRLQLFIHYDQAAQGQGKASLEAGVGYQLHY